MRKQRKELGARISERGERESVDPERCFSGALVDGVALVE
jgi:hypothetical protein